MNYWERHIGDYARDTAHLSMVEHGAYTLLLDRYYATEKPIPADQVLRLARARTRDEKDAVSAVLAEFFVLVDGQWHHNRADREIEKAAVRISTARENGTKGGRPRKQKESADKPNGFPLGSVFETQPKALHTPDSIHQTPRVSAAADKPPAKPSTAAAVREVFEFWKTQLGHQRAVFDPKRQRLIEARLKDFTVDDLKAAITGCSLSPHHMGKNDTGTRYDSLELILRDAGKVEFFQQIKPLQNQHPVTSTIPLDTVPIDWRHSNAGIEAKARELGMEQGSDQYPVFKRKVIAAAQAQENPQ